MIATRIPQKSFQTCTVRRTRSSVSVSASLREGEKHSAFPFLLSAAAAASLVFAPLEAGAVSGGGSISRPISGEDWSKRDLTKMKFTKAVMRGTDFTDANLEAVSLYGVVARGANFTGANLRQADLETGDFDGAIFENAILEGAYLENAMFANNVIDGSDWTDAQLRKTVQRYLCSIAKGTNPVTGVDTKDSLGC